METDKKRLSNQVNAKKSTGPRSTLGKHRASQNALRHGLSKAARPEASAAAVALAQVFCAEDAELRWNTATRLAAAITRLDEVTCIEQQMIENASIVLEERSSANVRACMARLAILPRLSALARYEARAAGTLRKVLRRL